MKTKTFLVTITSKNNSKHQLDQLLKEELKTDYINKYELEEVKITKSQKHMKVKLLKNSMMKARLMINTKN